MLILPAKPADAKGSVCFKDRHKNSFAPHSERLPVGDRHQCAIGDGFDVSVAQRVHGKPGCPDFEARKHSFLHVRMNRSILDKRSARMCGELRAVPMPCAQFCNLAASADNRISMTISAARGVVYRPKSIGKVFFFFKQIAVGVELRLTDEAIGFTIKTRQCRSHAAGIVCCGLACSQQHKGAKQRRHDWNCYFDRDSHKNSPS